MKKLIRRIASAIGIATDYHVSATYAQETNPNGWSAMHFTCAVKPWLHQDNFGDLENYAEQKAENPISTPVITSITRIGW